MWQVGRLYAVSVTWVFYGAGLLALCPTPQPGGQVDHDISDLYPLTCPAWVALLGDEDPAGKALRVSEHPFLHGFNFVRQITWNSLPHWHGVL